MRTSTGLRTAERLSSLKPPPVAMGRMETGAANTFAAGPGVAEGPHTARLGRFANSPWRRGGRQGHEMPPRRLGRGAGVASVAEVGDPAVSR